MSSLQPLTQMDPEPSDSDNIGQQNETLNADSSTTKLYIPPSPARSTLYATSTYTASLAGAPTTTTSTTLQRVMIGLTPLTGLQQTISSSSQQLPVQHRSLPEHQTANTGQQTFIPPAPPTYQPYVPVQVPAQS